MVQSNDLAGFSERLNTLCVERKVQIKARARIIGEMFGVSREAARKWLQGETYPDMKKRAAICEWANVNDTWLMTGIGDKHPTNTKLSESQRLALDLMQAMTIEQQALAVRLISQILDNDPDGAPHGTGVGPRSALSLHEKKHPH